MLGPRKCYLSFAAGNIGLGERQGVICYLSFAAGIIGLGEMQGLISINDLCPSNSLYMNFILESSNQHFIILN